MNPIRFGAVTMEQIQKPGTVLRHSDAMQEYLEAPVDTIFFVVKRSPDNTDNGNTDAFERKGQIVQPIYVQEYRWNPAAGVATKEGKRQRRELTFSPDGTPNPGFDVVRGACLRQEGDILEVPKLQAVV